MICFLRVNLYGLPQPCPKGHALLRAVVVERCRASPAGLYGESGDASLLPCHVDDEASPCTEATETAVASIANPLDEANPERNARHVCMNDFPVAHSPATQSDAAGRSATTVNVKRHRFKSFICASFYYILFPLPDFPIHMHGYLGMKNVLACFQHRILAPWCLHGP